MPLPPGATVTWKAPTENTDGSLLTDLAGFHLHYEQDGDDHVITIANPTIDIYVIEMFPSSGEWAVSMSAYNTAGAESALVGPVLTTSAP